MYKSRLLKEKKKLQNTNYEYIFNNEDNMISIFTNKGLIEIELPSSYPFSPPKIFIYANLIELDKNDAFLNYYLNKTFPQGIIDKIKNYIYPKNNRIHIKKYFYQNLQKYNDKDWFDVILDFDSILQQWSPVLFIINILEFLEDLNDKYKIKERYRFKILRN